MAPEGVGTVCYDGNSTAADSRFNCIKYIWENRLEDRYYFFYCSSSIQPHPFRDRDNVGPLIAIRADCPVDIAVHVFIAGSIYHATFCQVHASAV